MCVFIYDVMYLWTGCVCWWSAPDRQSTGQSPK